MPKVFGDSGQAASNVRHEPTQIYSFDVFDTLISRPFMRPADVFVAIGNSLSSRGRVAIDPRHYRDARRRAEQRARAASRQRDDCRWGEIFLHFPELSNWSLSADEVMEAELDAERLCCLPIAANVSRVRGLVKSGEEVIFLSDMYLPTDFIWELICKHVVECPKENVYVSGDLGLAKHTGRLYSYVIRRYGIAPSQLRHIGDNHYADVEVPTRLGVEATHYHGVQPTRHERLPRPRSRAPVALSAMHGIARAARLTSAYSEIWGPVASIAASVVAPVLTAYVAWVMRDARKRGIERLYFVSRDGQILKLIASQLRLDGDPECYYLYGSRQAWFLPSVQDVDEESLSWAWMKGMSRTGRDILRRLEIDDPGILALLAGEGFDDEALGQQLDESDLRRFKGLLMAEPIASIILERADRRRRLLLEYLAQEGCLDDSCWALVDIGWVLNCQRALNRVLKSAVSCCSVSGYYFGVSHDHAPLAQTGAVYPFITHSRARLQGFCEADWLFKKPSRAIIDHFFVVADHESVCSYRKEGQWIVPVYTQEDRKDYRFELSKIVHSVVREYADTVVHTEVVDPLSDGFQYSAIARMKEFCLFPHSDDVIPIADLPVTADQTHCADSWGRLARRLTLWEFLLILLSHFGLVTNRNPRQEFLWLAGSAAVSSWPVRLTVLGTYLVMDALADIGWLVARSATAGRMKR